MESSGAPSVTLIVGSGLSCLALVTLAVVYAALWRYVIDLCGYVVMYYYPVFKRC